MKEISRDDRHSITVVDRIVDKTGRPIDELIKPLVGAMRGRRIATTASCEGHLDHGNPFPWIEFENDDMAAAVELLGDWHRICQDGNRAWCIVPGFEDVSHIAPFDRTRPLAEMQDDAVGITDMVIAMGEASLRG